MTCCRAIVVLVTSAGLASPVHFIVAAPGAADKDPSASATRQDVPKADPAATRLLAEARAARAQWHKFPGFSAELDVSIGNRLIRGHVEVNSTGKLKLNLGDTGAQQWVKHTLGSIVFHRLDDESPDTPCFFLEDEATHPLGRLVGVVNDEFHSSYRIRDRQIIVVNRHMQETRLTIVVVENLTNEDKQFLPVCFMVHSWDGHGTLLSSASTHQTWQRVGAFDLPKTTTVVTAKPGATLEARRLTLSNCKLLP